MSLMPPVRLGIIGCGVIGRRHAQSAAASDLIDLRAVADLREEAAREVAGQFNVPTIYPNAEALLADPQIEAVVLAMPAIARTPIALQAFTAGKHVLTEKPVARNVAEVHQMLAAQGDRVAGCCSARFHFLPSTQAVTHFITSGALGELRVIRCRAIRPAGPPPATSPPAWRLSRELNGGGIMSNWGCYDLDYLLGITGWQLKPQTVLAQMWPVAPQFESHVAPGSDAETHVAALIRCAGGPTITFERGEYVAAHAEEAWQIIGSAGSLCLRMTPGPGKTIVHYATTSEEGARARTLWEGDETYELAHVGVLEDFVRAVRAGRQPQTNLERALVVQQITDAIYESAETGRAVSLT